MPGKQADITSFFSPKSNSSENVAKTSPKALKTTPLKRKIDEKENVEESSFSPDQKKRMANNKLKALIKVSSKRLEFVLNENIGPSWFQLLKDEFDKKYFQDLNEFLGKERQSTTKIFPPHDQVNF